MFLAKVTGSLVSTQKIESMGGHKLLVVEPYRLDAEDRSSWSPPAARSSPSTRWARAKARWC